MFKLCVMDGCDNCKVAQAKLVNMGIEFELVTEHQEPLVPALVAPNGSKLIGVKTRHAYQEFVNRYGTGKS